MSSPAATVATTARRRRRSESAGRRAVRRFMAHRAALLGLVIIAIISLASILAPLITHYNPDLVDLKAQLTPPNADHILGADRIGRDLFSRLLYAGRVSLAVGIAAALFATGLGTVLGLIAGMVGGPVDSFIMRMTDVVLAIPLLIAIVIIVGLVGTGVEIVILVIGLFGWTEAARIVRSVVLSLREQDFVTAARALGSTDNRIMRKHLLFHALAPMTVTGTFAVATALLTEAALSYLGIGVRPPQSSWGNMLYDAQQLFILAEMPWYWIPPGVMIFTVVLAVNLIGDGMRDALDPHEMR